MPVTPSSTVVGVFQNRSAADQAIEALYNAGFAREQMRYIASNTSGGFFEDLKNLFTGASANPSPSEGEAFNLLAAMGLSRETAQYYSDEYNKGNPVLVVNAPGREREGLDILKNYGAYNAQMKSEDDLRTNAPQQASYETPVAQSNAQSWEAYSQPQTSQEAPAGDQGEDTTQSRAVEPSSIATPDAESPLYPTHEDESVAENPEYAAASFSASAAASDAQQYTSSPIQEEENPEPQASVEAPEASTDEEIPVAQTDTNASESDVDELEDEETSASPADLDTAESASDESADDEVTAPQTNLNTYGYSAVNAEIPVSQTFESASDELEDEETPALQTSAETDEDNSDEIEVEEITAPQADLATTDDDSDELEDEETSVEQTDLDTAEGDSDEIEIEETSVEQADLDTADTETDEDDSDKGEVEEVTASQTDLDAAEDDSDELEDEEDSAEQGSAETDESEVEEGEVDEIPIEQANIDTSENEADENEDEEEVPTPQDNIGTSEYIVDDEETPASQTITDTADYPVVVIDEITDTSEDSANEETPVQQADMYTYQEAPLATDFSTQATDFQPLSQRTDAEHTEELQQIQDQIKFTQQQLQDARAKLEATKERENQYRKRQKQLQNSKKQLQELQEELQATQAELQETETRVASYQYQGIEDRPKKQEKAKKFKNQRI